MLLLASAKSFFVSNLWWKSLRFSHHLNACYLSTQRCHGWGQPISAHKHFPYPNHTLSEAFPWAQQIKIPLQRLGSPSPLPSPFYMKDLLQFSSPGSGHDEPDSAANVEASIGHAKSWCVLEALSSLGSFTLSKTTSLIYIQYQARSRIRKGRNTSFIQLLKISCTYTSNSYSLFLSSIFFFCQFSLVLTRFCTPSLSRVAARCWMNRCCYSCLQENWPLDVVCFVFEAFSSF